MFFHYSISRDPDVWQNPNEFMPERFDRATTTADSPERQLVSIPFGFGTRGCIGMANLLTNISYIVNSLFLLLNWYFLFSQNIYIFLAVLAIIQYVAGKRIAEMELSMCTAKVSIYIVVILTTMNHIACHFN